MKLWVIKTNNIEIICEIVKRGLFSIAVKNPVRILDTAATGKLSLGYTVYSPFTTNENISINRMNIVSISELKGQHVEFYNKTVTLLNTLVIPELDGEIGKFAIEIDQAMKRFADRKEYLEDDAGSDVVIVDNKKPPRNKLN